MIKYTRNIIIRLITMKRLFLIIFAITTLIFTSCNNDSKPITSNGDENPITTPNEIVSEQTPEEMPERETPESIKKPETIEEIIEFTNSLKVNGSMADFSLEGILESVQLPESEDAGDEYQSTTAYLGDSVTMGLSFFKNHPAEMVIAKGSINPLDAVEKKLIELDDGTFVNFPVALSKTGAKRAVLTFGSNAISIMSEETFLKYYIKLLDAIEETCPDCDIIIQSITPLASTCTLKKLTNDLVNRSNLLLLVLAYSRDLKFLDTTSQMKDSEGYMKLEFCSSDDGIHINQQGYEVWINMLRTHELKD